MMLPVFDDAVVHDGDAIVHVRVRVALDRLAVRCPVRMAKSKAVAAAYYNTAAWAIADKGQLKMASPA
jgi:hypothetical protein